MISNLATIICALLTAACGAFLIFGFSDRRHVSLIKKLYLLLCIAFITWPMALIAMRFSPADDLHMLAVWDAFTYIGVCFCPVLMLMICVVFVTNCEKLPKWCYLLLIVPILTNVIVWTNPLHHLHYVVFSIIRSELVFGPYIFINGVYTYVALLASILILLRFGQKNNVRLYWAQIAMLVGGVIVPLVVNCMATFSGINVSIAATPISFSVTLICNYLAIYRLHLLDIVPIANQHIMDWIPDGYLILNENGLIVDNNRYFRQVFEKVFHISANQSFREKLENSDEDTSPALYHLISAVDNCAATLSPVAYEQPIPIEDENGNVKNNYYMVDITPLQMANRLIGFVVIFKDITQVRSTMQQVQQSQARLMEQEHLASLGQMVGGLAHNLKTPIMSIAGCSSSIETLLTEEDASLGDPEVTAEDYQEIHNEIRDWLSKIRSSCSYMSDIINAVKGQAASANATEDRDFTLDETIKRSMLLMRHELKSAGCTLEQTSGKDLLLMLHGDINSLVQVLNNLISNAIDASRDSEKKQILLHVALDEKNLTLSVQDSGCGIEPQVLEKLFQEMTTTKGTKGTGLGLYISNSLIRGKFNGRMFAQNNPGGGAKIGFTIPRINSENVQIRDMQEVKL